MTTTQKTLIPLAAALRRTSASEATVRAVAEVLAKDNHRFSYERFLDAALSHRVTVRERGEVQ
jgi:hypothetical protein